jgi:hypothetical protein
VARNPRTVDIFCNQYGGLFVFPPPGAIRAINQVLPNTDVIVSRQNFPKCGGRTYLFGYDFFAHGDIGRDVDPDRGRACRDIVGSVWVVDIDRKYK